jgi:hypothetical protein
MSPLTPTERDYEINQYLSTYYDRSNLGSVAESQARNKAAREVDDGWRSESVRRNGLWRWGY